jgi:predicted GNAT family acetyltransferase
MLETGHFYGIRRDHTLVSVAGVHVYSPLYKVGVVGNVTTHPDYRGKGLGTAVCARLCQQLLQTAEHIGLNVKADNVAAIASYKRLGFEVVGEYEEALLSTRLA